MGGRPKHARSDPHPSLAREPGLDGLRGVAVALVLLFHGGVGVVGGALGVDVFLVLSGYLITRLLLVELDDRGRVDLAAFWARRLRRLLPAVLVLVAVVAVVARPDPGDGLAALGWWSNWHFAAADHGYFEAFADPSPLRHTWSLAVEEQWYLLWPPLLVLLHRTRLLLGAVVGLAVASAAAMWVLAGDVDRVHFGTDTRAQGLLVGAALAVAVSRRPTAAWSALSRRGATAAGAAGAAVLATMALRVPGTAGWLYHGGHLLVAVAAAAIAAAAVLPAGPVRWALSLRPLRAVGRVSYGAYLWHWPVFVWLTPDRTGLDRWPLLAMRVGVTSVLTVASWRLVERPVLEGHRRLPRPRLAIATGFVAAIAVLAATTALDGPGSGGSAQALASRPAPTLPAAFASSPETSVPPTTVRGVLDRPPAPADPPSGDPVVTVVGDSTAWALGWDVEPVDGVEVYDGGMIGCGLSPEAVVIGGAPERITGQPVPCTEAPDLWRWWVASTDPDVVVLGFGAWDLYDRVLDDGRRLDVGTREWAAFLDAALEDVVTDIAAAAPSAPLLMPDVPCFEEQDLALGEPASPRDDGERVAAVNEVFAAFVARHPARLTALPMSEWLCGNHAVDRPDGVHLAPDSARSLWTGPLGDAVRAALAQGPGVTTEGSAPGTPSRPPTLARSAS